MDKPAPEELRQVERRRWARIIAFVVFLLIVGAVVLVVGRVSWKDHLINLINSSPTEEIRIGQTSS